MKKLIVFVALMGIAPAVHAAELTPMVQVMGGSGAGYVVTQTSVSISSSVATVYPSANHYREFLFVDDGLSATNSYYYRIDGATTAVSAQQGGIPFTTPYTMESSNQVVIYSPVGSSGRILRVRIRER